MIGIADGAEEALTTVSKCHDSTWLQFLTNSGLVRA
jgi:hypothetical protein